jgi:hypothetical protein
MRRSNGAILSGCDSRNAAISGVEVGPGLTTLQVMPRRANSWASDLQKALIPPFAAA